MLQREKNLKPHPPFNAVHSTCTRKLVSPPTNLKLLWVTNSKLLWVTADTQWQSWGSTWTWGEWHGDRHCQGPSTPELSSAVTFTASSNCQVFGFQSRDCLYSLQGKWSPQELLFLAVCRSGIYIWFIFSICNHRETWLFLNNEFLDNAVEEAATRRMCWFTKPPQYTQVWLLCTERGDSVVLGPLILHSMVLFGGNKSPSTI